MKRQESKIVGIRGGEIQNHNDGTFSVTPLTLVFSDSNESNDVDVILDKANTFAKSGEVNPDDPIQSVMADSYMAGWNAKPSIKWKKIDPNNIPTQEVYGCLFREFIPQQSLIGIIEKSHQSPSGFVCIESGQRTGGVDVINCTHYIPLSDLLHLEIEKWNK